MKILVINCGSSSIKYRLFDMRQEVELAAGSIDRIGKSNALARTHWTPTIRGKIRKGIGATDGDAVQ